MGSRIFKAFCLSICIAGLSAVAASSSSASTVTVGPTLPMPVADNFLIGCGSCLVFNPSAPGATSDVSPVDGIVLRWRLYYGSILYPPQNAHPEYRLRVISPLAPSGYLGAGTSPVSIPIKPKTVETFPAHLPIKAGQLIALELVNQEAKSHFGGSTAVTSVVIEPSMADGEVGTPAPGWEDGFVFPFNADVLPRPSIGDISPNRGSITGKTEVVITGSDFAEVESVTFGDQRATFTVDSESQLIAVVPPSPKPTSAPVTVVTAAGSAVASQKYVYKGCVVPRLKGKTLKRARRLLRRNECRLGRVRKRPDTSTKSSQVRRQSPHSGTVLPPGGRVEVALGT